MIHAFSGTQDDLRALTELGGYFSFRILKGISERKQHVFIHVPVDRLLLETDFPYLAAFSDQTQAGADEYFSYLRELYAEAGALRGIQAEALQKIVRENGTIFMH